MVLILLKTTELNENICPNLFSMFKFRSPCYLKFHKKNVHFLFCIRQDTQEWFSDINILLAKELVLQLNKNMYELC